MLKLIYLAKRKPGYTRDQFIRRWRLHGSRGMSGPFWENVFAYSQCEPIIPTPLVGGSEEYDAVAYTMMRNDAFAAFTPADVENGKMMIEDERQTFAHLVYESSIWVTEEKLKPGDLGGVTAFFFFRDAGVARQVAEFCKNIEEASRVTLNVKNTAVVDLQSTLPYDAVIELATDSRAILSNIATTMTRLAIAKADLTVITREAVMWDRLSDTVA